MKGFLRVSIDNVDIRIVESLEPPVVSLQGPNDGCADVTACNFCGYEPWAYDWICTCETQDGECPCADDNIPDNGGYVWGAPPWAPLECDPCPNNDCCEYLDDYCSDFYSETICGAEPLPEIPNTGGQRCAGCMSEVELSSSQSVWQVVNSSNPVYSVTNGYQHTWCEFCGDTDASNYNSNLDGINGYISSPGMCVYHKCTNPQQTDVEVCNLYIEGTEPGITMANTYHDESLCIYAWPGCECSSQGTAYSSATCLDCVSNQPDQPLSLGEMNPNGNNINNSFVTFGACSCDGNGQTITDSSAAVLAGVTLSAVGGVLTNGVYLDSQGNNAYYPGAVGLPDNVTFCDAACQPDQLTLEPQLFQIANSGMYETVGCGCGTTILPEMAEVYCDCAGTKSYSTFCGCNGTITGTEFLPQYGADLTMESVTLSAGGQLSVASAANAVVPCDCEGTEMANTYYLDMYGEGYGWDTTLAIKVCSDVADQIIISHPNDPVLGGYTQFTYDCNPATRDCAGHCPGTPEYGAATNECGECVEFVNQQQDINWEENCCESDVYSGTNLSGGCQLCPDAHLGEGAWIYPQVGAMQAVDTPNPNTNSLDQQGISVIVELDASNNVTQEATFYTCNCQNLTSLGNEFVNYYDIRYTLLHQEDGCSNCRQLNDPARLSIAGGTPSQQAAFAVILGVPGGNIVQDAAGNFYCSCNTAPGGNSHISPEESRVFPGLGCCGSNVLDCNGECVPANTAPVEDCEGVCGGSAVVDECGVCNGPGILEGNCDCEGHVLDCNNDCGGTSVVDPCGDCRESVDAINYGQNCWVCGDENAQNYVPFSEDDEDYTTCPNNSCCDYLTLSEIIIDDQQTSSLAQGTIVSSENLEGPWAVVDHVTEDDFPTAESRTKFHEFYANPDSSVVAIWNNNNSPEGYGLENGNFSSWISGWAETNIGNNFQFSNPALAQGVDSEFINTSGIPAVYNAPKISWRLQKVSSTNLKIVCEAPASNALVSYTIYDPNNIVIQTNVYFYGATPFTENSIGMGGDFMNWQTYNSTLPSISAYYDIIEANQLDTYADISKVYYYFYIDADAPFDNLDVETIFASVDENGNLRYPDIMKVGYMTIQATQHFISGEEVGTGNAFDTIGTLQKGLNYMLPTTNADLPDVPVYHVYRIEVKPGANFTIHFEDIPGVVTPPPVYGCMEEGACNYNPYANTPSEAFECQYPEEGYYCDGTQIPVYGCMDPNSTTYNSNANTPSEDYPCEYEGCMDPLADNYDQNATIDNNSCIYSLPCNNIPQTPICCEPSYFNSASQNDYNIVNNIAVAIDECNVCDNSICSNEDTNIYVCTDENAINTWAGDWIPGVTVSSNSVCDYFESEPSNLHVRMRVYQYQDLTQQDINSIEWVIYDTNSTLVATNTYMSLNAPIFTQSLLGVYQTFLYNLDNVITPSTCLWFIPVGYPENNIWNHIELDIMFGGESIHKLYGWKTPIIQNVGITNLLSSGAASPYTFNYQNNVNYSSSIDTGVCKIVKQAPCEEGCTHNDNTTLQTESCVGILKKDSLEFTEVFLFVETAQQNVDFSTCSIVMVDLDTGNDMILMTGFEPNKSYKRRFVVEKESTRIGIKAVGNGLAPITYKLVSEFGKIITYKTFI